MRKHAFHEENGCVAACPVCRALATVEQALTDKDAEIARFTRLNSELTADYNALAITNTHDKEDARNALARLTAERDEARRERDEPVNWGRNELMRDLSAALRRAEAAESEVARLRDALREIWDDFCTSHMGDCNCVVCSLTADALNISREVAP
jgi:hypothetical protein